MAMNRRDRKGRAGFVLPTVTMVILVVVLLSLAITFRAFDRAKDAQYTRVSQQTLNAVAPAIDRARAKVTQALQKVTEISDEEIYKELTTGDLYKFGDEDVVQVRYDISGDGSIQPTGTTEKLNDDEQVETAWRFPFDTDNNGKYDSFILYGIFSTTPDQGKPRNPLNARTQPLPSLEGRQECAFVSGGVDDLVTEEGLTPTRGKFKKSIFAYATTVPITEEMMTAQSLADTDYEQSQGSSGASPLEYQQDWQIKPLNGVVYRDDLEINPGPAFNFNGSLLTQSNLIASPFANNITLYQVSAKKSCFYDADLSKIIVGGNVINGMVGNTTERKPVEVHLFQGENADPKKANISSTNQSISQIAQQGMYNDEEYRGLIEDLVQAQLAKNKSTDPPEVQPIVERRITEEGDSEERARRDELERYYKAREPKISYQAVTVTPAQLEATEPSDETRKTGVEDRLGDRVLVGNNQPALKQENSNGRWVAAKQELGTWTDTGTDRERPTQAEELPAAGDRSRDGFWEKAAARLPKTFIEGVGGLRVVTGGGVYERESSFLPPPNWNFDPTRPTDYPKYDDPATSATEAYPIVWPDTMPMSPVPDSKVFDNDPTSTDYQDWVSVPSPLPTGNAQFAKGDLKMRATAVYHYAQDAFNPPEDLDQTPIACVSSYYDPSTLITAFNETGLGWNEDPDTTRNGGRSNNGIVYGPPTTARPGQSTVGAGGLLGGASPSPIEEQANYVFPDGRFANKPLREALLKDAADRSLADQAAIDATLCSLGILGTTGFTLGADPTYLNAFDGAIKEIALLNGREVKAIHKDNDKTTVDETFTFSSPLTGAQKANVDRTKYDLPLEDRQPLEVRVTQIDLELLRNTTIANTNAGLDELDPEYMLPYSGIIYATRDDALPDRSYQEGDTTTGVDEDKSKALSPVDFVLDPTRRPNGIMLINGGSLGRNNSQSPKTTNDLLKEKGLTLISNLPVYIKADERDAVASDNGKIDARGTFNKHTQTEFTEPFDWAFAKFYNDRKTLDPNFACRKGDPIREELDKACSEGDNWRPVTVFADAITLLSDEYKFGYRNEGDFDLRNNAGNAVVGYDFNGNDEIKDDSSNPAVNEVDFGIDLNGDNDRTDTGVKETEVTAKAARQLNGFNAYNDFAVNGLSVDVDLDGAGTDYTRAYTDELYRTNNKDALDSSYFNNYSTPIQRRGTFSEYVMEICLKPFVSACQPGDWVVVSGGTQTTASIATTYTQIDGSGTTARPPSPEYLRFPRRVAFLRGTSGANKNKLDFDVGSSPIPRGIKNNNIINATFADAATTPDTAANALWFQTGSGTTRNWGSGTPLWYYNPQTPGTSLTYTGSLTAGVQQPLLVPVLQIHASDSQPSANAGAFPVSAKKAQENTRWLPRPSRQNYEYNLVFGAGDVPGRPGETNGGLQNLARFIENWQQVQSSQESKTTTTIQGSFVQSGRSEYSTAPYIGLRGDGQIFGQNARYNVENASGQIGYFAPPNRSWGFDVGLLSQSPDYFSRKFARLDKDVEGKVIVQQYFRELPKDDPWVKGILCAKVKDNGENAAPDEIRGSLKCSEKTDRTNKYDS
jgi:hypothetical protein